jgi:hypothetical protein
LGAGGTGGGLAAGGGGAGGAVVVVAPADVGPAGIGWLVVGVEAPRGVAIAGAAADCWGAGAVAATNAVSPNTPWSRAPTSTAITTGAVQFILMPGYFGRWPPSVTS